MNETEITGSFDFNLPTDNPNRDDVISAVHDVLDHLGLKITRGRGPVSDAGAEIREIAE